jgi:hypothetical protein
VKRIASTVVALFFIGATLTACTGGQTIQPANTPPAATASPPDTAAAAKANANAATIAAHDKANSDQARQALTVLEGQVKSAPSTDVGLSLIVSHYCILQADPTPEEEDELIGLPSLFHKYWVAGGKWDFPLSAAVQQQGACPTQNISGDNGY